MNNQTIGFSVSILMHSLFGLLFLAGGTSLLGTPGPISLDFSLVTSAPEASQIVQPKPVHKIENARLKEKSPLPPQETVVKKEQKAPVIIPEEIAQITEPEETMALQEEPVVQEIVEPSPLHMEELAQSENVSTNQETASIESLAQPALLAESQPQGLGTIYYKKHFNYIKDGIQNQIIYPRQAKMMGWEGRVLLSFTVCADGRVEDITIKESSGFAVLDKKAIETVRKAAPFPSPPVRAELTIPIVFNLV